MCNYAIITQSLLIKRPKVNRHVVLVDNMSVMTCKFIVSNHTVLMGFAEVLRYNE